MKKNKKYSPRVQTTCLASFGPVFTVPTHPVTYFVIRTYIYNKSIVSIKKNRRIILKSLPRTQTMHLASFGPVFVVPTQSIEYLLNV